MPPFAPFQQPVQQPSAKTVAFKDLDSDEEGKRTARGMEFRRKRKVKRQKKRAARQARLDLAESAYQVLILETNRDGLLTLFRDSPRCQFIFDFVVYPYFMASPHINHRCGGRRGGTSAVLLDRIRRTNAPFQQFRKDTNLVSVLEWLAVTMDFGERFLGRQRETPRSARYRRRQEQRQRQQVSA